MVDGRTVASAHADLLAHARAAVAALREQPTGPTARTWWAARLGDYVAKVRPELEYEAAVAAMTPPEPEPAAPLTAVQREVMGALRGRALTGDDLAAELDADRSTLIRSHLRPLMGAGLVVNDRRVGGYYRPDAPPQAH